MQFDWRPTGHRLRVTRLVLGISEQEAADAYGVTLRTYRKYEAGHPQKGCRFLGFARKYDVCIDWLICGEPAFLSINLTKRAAGKIAILPTEGPWYRLRNSPMAVRESQIPWPA